MDQKTRCNIPLEGTWVRLEAAKEPIQLWIRADTLVATHSSEVAGCYILLVGQDEPILVKETAEQVMQACGAMQYIVAKNSAAGTVE